MFNHITLLTKVAYRLNILKILKEKMYRNISFFQISKSSNVVLACWLMAYTKETLFVLFSICNIYVIINFDQFRKKSWNLNFFSGIRDIWHILYTFFFKHLSSNSWNCAWLPIIESSEKNIHAANYFIYRRLFKKSWNGFLVNLITSMLPNCKKRIFFLIYYQRFHSGDGYTVKNEEENCNQGIFQKQNFKNLIKKMHMEKAIIESNWVKFWDYSSHFIWLLQ